MDQYPPQYLTGQKSEGGNHDSSADYSKNPNLFTITTIAAGDWIIGDPSHIVNGKVETKNDELSNNMISPRFIAASRYAAVSAGTYTWQMAHDRCLTYWETLDPKKTGKSATYPPGKWRMPTLAELKFMDVIQEASPASIICLIKVVNIGEQESLGIMILGKIHLIALVMQIQYLAVMVELAVFMIYTNLI